MVFLTLQAVLCTSVNVCHHESIKLALNASVTSGLFWTGALYKSWRDKSWRWVKSRFLNFTNMQRRTMKHKLVLPELLAGKYSQKQVAVAVTTLLITCIWKVPDWENWSWPSGVWYNSVIILHQLNTLTNWYWKSCFSYVSATLFSNQQPQAEGIKSCN